MFDCSGTRSPTRPRVRRALGRYYVALLRFLGCTADAHEFAELIGGDDIAVQAVIARVLGGPPSEFETTVMPKIGAGHNLLVRPGWVLGMMRAGKERARDGIRAHCELSEHLAIRLGLAPGVRAGLQARSSTGMEMGCRTAGQASRSRCQRASSFWHET